MNISRTHWEYITEALSEALVGINDGTSTYGEARDLHLNGVGHDARKKVKAALVLIEKLSAAEGARNASA